MSRWHIRVWRRFRVSPHVTLNLSRSGLSTSIGVRHAHITLGRRGVRRTIGLGHGTGIYATRFDRYAHHTVQPHPMPVLLWWMLLLTILLAALSVHAAPAHAKDPPRVHLGRYHASTWTLHRHAPELHNKGK
jgi:hypothetical protein